MVKVTKNGDNDENDDDADLDWQALLHDVTHELHRLVLECMVGTVMQHGVSMVLVWCQHGVSMMSAW
jgi:hypothetical protein